MFTCGKCTVNRESYITVICHFKYSDPVSSSDVFDLPFIIDIHQLCYVCFYTVISLKREKTYKTAFFSPGSAAYPPQISSVYETYILTGFRGHALHLFISLQPHTESLFCDAQISCVKGLIGFPFIRCKLWSVFTFS